MRGFFAVPRSPTTLRAAPIRSSALRSNAKIGQRGGRVGAQEFWEAL
ncbi:MAG: hypothetical protein R3F11_31600 [Verrucomicrobiales bacterium]